MEILERYCTIFVQFHGNGIRNFGLLFNHFVLFPYNLSQFEYFYMVQRYQCHHLNHKICQSSLLFRDQRGICESVTELPDNWAKFFSWEEFLWSLQHRNFGMLSFGDPLFGHTFWTHFSPIDFVHSFCDWLFG